MSRDLSKRIFAMNIPSGLNILITGGNSGIGFETAKALATKGANLILAVRSLERGETARQQILAKTPEADVRLMHLDLASKASIDSFIEQIIREQIDIDIFYANAGIYRVPFATLYGGLESHMAVNFAANYYLYQGLKDYFHSLPHQVKFIFTSSIVARFAKIKETDLFGEKKYHKQRAYNKSKLAVNYLYTYVCDKEKSSNIAPLLVHPGITYTPLIDKAYSNRRFQRHAQRFIRLFCHKPDKAALSTLRLCEADIQSPCFCGPRGPFHISGYPKIYRLYAGNIKNWQAFCETLDTLPKE